jgi:hypothetical protein
MCVGRKTFIFVVCMAGLSIFGQETASGGKNIDELQKYIHLGSVIVSNYRDKQNQKMILMEISSDQDKDMGFDGVMRITVELTGDDGDVWYGQTLLPQGKKLIDYLGEDAWSVRFSIGSLKYPSLAYAVEYGYQTTEKTFITVDQKLVKVASADEIMERNKDSKNLLKLKTKTRADSEDASGNDSGDAQ